MHECDHLWLKASLWSNFLSQCCSGLDYCLFICCPSIWCGASVCMAKHWTQVQEQISAVIEPCDWHERRYRHPCLLSQVACSWCNTIKLSLLGGVCVLVSRVRVQWPETVTGSREQNSPVWRWNALYIAALSAEQMGCVLCKCVSDI